MNSSKPKLTSKPPVRSVDEFIAEAEHRPRGEPSVPAPPPTNPPPEAAPSPQPRAHQATRRNLPWERPSVRADVRKPYNLRLPEAYLLKLKFIAENTPDSMQTFCLAALLPAIDKKLEELLNK